MSELVFLQKDVPVTTSLLVAESFGKNHFHVVRDIRNLIEEMASVSQPPKLDYGVRTPMFQESTYNAEDGGRSYPMYYMTFDGFTLLTMGFTGKKALQFKLEYIAAFNAMREKLTELLIERRNDEWREVRASSKRSNRKLTDAIQQHLIPLARAQGSTAPDRVFYMNYERTVNKCAGINPKSRDKISVGQLYEVDKMLDMAAILIKGDVAAGSSYKQIYQDMRQTLDGYAQISLINQRFIETRD